MSEPRRYCRAGQTVRSLRLSGAPVLLIALPGEVQTQPPSVRPVPGQHAQQGPGQRARFF